MLDAQCLCCHKDCGGNEPHARRKGRPVAADSPTLVASVSSAFSARTSLHVRIKSHCMHEAHRVAFQSSHRHGSSCMQQAWKLAAHANLAARAHCQQRGCPGLLSSSSTAALRRISCEVASASPTCRSADASISNRDGAPSERSWEQSSQPLCCGLALLVKSLTRPDCSCRSSATLAANLIVSRGSCIEQPRSCWTRFGTAFIAFIAAP